MRLFKFLLAATLAMPLAVTADMEAQQGTGSAGGWAKRMPIKPDPSKIVVPKGYKVGVFAAGLDTPSSATVDRTAMYGSRSRARCSAGPSARSKRRM